MSTVTDDIASPAVSTEGGSPTDARMENAVRYGQHQDTGAKSVETLEASGKDDQRIPGVSTVDWYDHGRGPRIEIAMGGAGCRLCGDRTHRAQDAVCVEDNS